MPKTRVQKTDILGAISDRISRSKAAVFVNFSGIPVKELNQLRDQCFDSDVDYLVAKKTLLKRALRDQGFTQEVDLSGEIAALFGYSDEIAPAKLASTFAKTNQQLKMVGGIIDGAIIDGQQVVALAKLPSKQELLAKAVGSIQAPLSGFVNVLQGNLRGLVYALKAISDRQA